MKTIRFFLLAIAMVFIFSVPSFAAITIELIDYNDWTKGGITSTRSEWNEVAEVEDVVTDLRITASNYSIFNVGPNPWNSGLWIFGPPGDVQVTFTNPSDSLFVQFESDANDGVAEFYIDGVLEYTLDTYNGSWFAVVFKDLPMSAHTIKVVAAGAGAGGADLAIDAIGSGAPVSEIPVFFDIKPTSCPNPLNRKSNGVLPVAILGTEDFDVTTIDPLTIRLSLDGNRDGGVAPLRSDFEDVATPLIEGDECECHDLGPDDYMDLTLKFSTQDLVAMNLSSYAVGEVVPLILTGNLLESAGDTPIIGRDCVLIVK